MKKKGLELSYGADAIVMMLLFSQEALVAFHLHTMSQETAERVDNNIIAQPQYTKALRRQIAE